ncbi:MAG: arylamine N-acetyltransferase [Cyclobacteriaceae bacterium]|nr:arylamine N-acetyltransferase [Cyclobacteriaceae bacterium SS2]
MARLNHFKTRPKLQQIPTDEYLERLKIKKENPALSFLKKLHRAHLQNIPFENLDILFGKRMELDIHKFFEKIVRQKRGGIPTELNILFYHLLDGLGFNCLLVSGRNRSNGDWVPDFDIPLIIVTLEDEDYLVDVGSLSLFMEPKRMETETLQLDYNQYFRFKTDPDGRFILQKSFNSIEFENIYIFGLEPKEVIQFLEMFRYHQSADSSFSQEKVVFQHTTKGKVMLTDKLLLVEEKGQKTQYPILHEDDFASKLHDHFGLDYNKLFRERLDQ